MIGKPSNLSKWLALTAVMSVASSALAASTPAGTQITNVAAANFTPVTPGGPSTSNSNVVTTTVQEVCAVSLTGTGAGATILGGDQLSFAYTLVNAGNANATLPVSVSGSGLTPAPQLTVYLDSNGNGQVDNGEQPVSSVNLPADGSAKLVVVVKTSEGTQGDGLINLVTSCAGGNAVTASNQVKVNPPPTLVVQKSFTPAVFKPGEETTVHVTTTNSSSYTSREVILTDNLADERNMGLEYVPGSATANVGVIEYTSDGTSWSSVQPATVLGVRVRVPELAAGAAINLDFRMKAAESADGKKIPNVAMALTSGASTSGTAVADVHYNPGVAIGPVGNPEAPEGTPADTQTKPFAVVGQQVCFDHTLKNTGDVQDYFHVTITFPQGTATTQLLGADGKPLVQPILLKPGESVLVRVCYTPTQTGPLEAVVTVNGDRGTTNTTKDLISDIQVGYPELKKSYVATGRDLSGKPITLNDGASVALGDTVTYTLTVRNPYPRPLNNVVVSDPIPAHLDFVSASDNGQCLDGGVTCNTASAGSQVVSWNVGTLGAGETRTLTIVAKVNGQAVDGELLSNIFNMVSTEFPDPLKSNEVDTPVWNAQLIIHKDVSPKVITYGDKVTYTVTVHNSSASTPIVDAVVTDTPAPGLTYIASTSTLGGQALVDPTIASNGVMKWSVGTIPAGGDIVITYQMRVTPGVAVDKDLVNVVQANGYGAGSAHNAIGSNISRASIKIDPQVFAAMGDLLGTVFVDRNRNGLYDAGLDTPVERARVILSSGRLSITDAKGRYHFSNVPSGSWALRLDPNTTPYPPLKLPQEGGLSGSQTVYVRGLTSVDFPLAPLAGDASVLRRTTLTMGDVSVEKSVYAVPGGYVVNLKIKSPTALSGFHLEDPLPGGAILKEGRNILDGTLDAGETNLTYHFDWTGQPNAVTTDPVMNWRY